MKKAEQQQTVQWYIPTEGTPLVAPPRPNPQEYVAIIFGIMLMTVFPLLVGPFGYVEITEFKFWSYVVTVAIFALVMGLSVLGYYLSTARRKQKPEFRFTLPQFLLLGYLLAAVISTVMTPYDYNVWLGGGRYEGLLSVILYVVTFLLFSFFGTYSGWYIRGLALAGIPIGIIGILQLLGKNPFGFFPAGVGGYVTNHFLGTLGNIDMVSGFVALVLPALACAYILLCGKKFRPVILISFILLLFVQLNINVDSGKMGLLAALVVMLPILAVNQERIAGILEIGAAVCFTFALFRVINLSSGFNENGEVYAAAFSVNRTVLIAAAAALILAGLAFLLRKKSGIITLSPKVLRLIIIGLLLLLIVAAILFLYSYDGGNILLTQIRDVLHGTLSDTAGSGRGYVWKKSVALIGEKPLIGSGPDSFVYGFQPYNDEYNAITGADVFFDFAHNDFLQVGVNYGLIGLGFYLAFLVALAVRAFRVADRNPLVNIFIAAAIGYLAHSFFSFSIAILTPLFWCAAGLLEHCIRQTVPAGNEVPLPERKTKKAK